MYMHSWPNSTRVAVVGYGWAILVLWIYTKRELLSFSMLDAATEIYLISERQHKKISA